MPNDDSNIGLSQDLVASIDELQAALKRASDAASTIRALAPRVAALGPLFDSLEAVIHAGREQVGAAVQSAPQPMYPRPTLVEPNGTSEQVSTKPIQQESPETRGDFAQPVASTHSPEVPTAIAVDTPAKPANASGEALICFRLEFESTPGPLDLRTVDDAVSEHPDVRDVALIDYDGRKATLKVWIVATAQPSSVQESLTSRATKLFGKTNAVSVVALEDVA